MILIYEAYDFWKFFNFIFRFSADVEIQKFMDPRLVETGRVVHLGRMSIHLSLKQRIKPAIRRESESVDNGDLAILEVSNDFLA